MNAPQRLHVILRTLAYTSDTDFQPVAVKIDGEFMDWDKAPVKHDGNCLEVDGQLYRYERKYGERTQDGYWYIGHAYRLMEGYNVLAQFTVQGEVSDTIPQYKHPTPDRAEAEELARWLVTQNLTTYGTQVLVNVVPQRGREYRDPVATLDGSKHDRHEAARCMMRGKFPTR